ncbi:DUF3732 domain-containing protein, partial [Trinickia sp.]|uniref:DUF3732 domain-containing protein n=1 Tax=Trinickia sp. TaxID=2571163 RepID=UPI003F8011C0
YGDEDNKRQKGDEHSDEAKISAAFRLLDNFVKRMNSEYKSEFQMIVFEHVPKLLFKDMPHIHLVEEFRGGNALIPRKWIP